MMKKLLVRALVVLIVLFVAMQFVPVDRSNPPITGTVTAPEPVMQVLRNSCFDCHSNETNWPWYSYIAPVSWLVTKDVHEGREEFNFSHWDRYTERERARIASDCYEEVSEGEMPLWIYVVMHPSAAVRGDKLIALREWSIAMNAGNGSRGRDDD